MVNMRGGLCPTSGAAHFQRPGGGGARRCDRGEEANRVELSVTGGASVGKAVGVVVGIDRHERAIVQLDTGDEFPGERRDSREVAGATLVVPDVHADSAVGAVGLSTMRRASWTDTMSVNGTNSRPTTSPWSAARSQSDPKARPASREIVAARPDDLYVPTLELVGHSPRRGFPFVLVDAATRE